MRRVKKGLAVLFIVSLLVFAFTATAGAYVGSKQTKLDYNNFKITVDGQPVNLSVGVEPFTIDSVTYIPLRIVGEALKCNVNWQGDTKTVVITSGASVQTTTLLQQVAQKDIEIQELKQQVSQLQIQLTEEEEEKGNSNLYDLEDELLDDFDEIEDVDVDDIWLDGDEDEINVEVEVDLDDYEDEWLELTDSDIRIWVMDLVGDIQDELDRKTEVNGEIINSDNGDVLVKFSKDGTRSLSVTYKDSNYRGNGVDDVEDELEGDRFDVGDIEFKITYINYYEGDDEIYVRLTAEDDDAAEQWDDLSTSEKENDVEDICQDIADAFEDDANAEPEIISIFFYDEGGDSLESYEYDVKYDVFD